MAADIVTKRLVMASIPLNGVRRILGDFVRLTYIRNPGAAFGLFPSSRYFLIGISLVAVVVVVWVVWTRRARLITVFPLGLILGGALGNLLGRIRAGEVVDFIQVGIPPHYWPVFNVADSAVSIGVTWLAVGLMFWEGRDRKPGPAVLDDKTSEASGGDMASSRD